MSSRIPFAIMVLTTVVSCIIVRNYPSQTTATPLPHKTVSALAAQLSPW